MFKSKAFQTLAVISFFILLGLYFFHPIPLQGPNVDLGHHLLLGKIISPTGNIPKTNLLSFTYPNYPFVNTHWLSDVVFYQWKNLFGFNGLIFLAFFLIAGAFALTFFAVQKKGGFLMPILVSLVYLQIMIDRTEVKPEIFSLFLLSVFLSVLYKYKEKFTKLIFLLIPLSLLWVNLHIYFIVGPILLLLFSADIFIAEKRKLKSPKFQAIAFVFLASLLVTLINPNTLRGALYPLFVFNNYGYHVIENANFITALKSIADLTFLYFGLSVISLWVLLILFRKKVKPADIFVSLLFTFLAFFAVRNFSLFVFGTFIPFVAVLNIALRELSKKINTKQIFLTKFILAVSVFIIILPAVFWSINIHGVGLGVNDNANDAIDFFIKNNLKGPIYNNYNIGNYLEYRLYPREKVYVDGRPEGYPKSFFEKEYYPAELSIKGFNKVDSKRHFNTIFYEHKNQTQNENPLLKGLAKSSTWKIVYVNSSIVIFVKNTTENKKLISSNTITEDAVKISEADLGNRDKLGDLSNFFRVIGWYKPMFDADMKYLSYDPTNCIALRHVTVIMKQTNNPETMIYLEKYSANCM